MALTEYNQIIREHFNLSDKKTRQFVIEADQSQLVSALASALYDKIVDKVDKIDFGTIPKSRGDITKVDGFDNTVECLNIMRKLVLEYKEKPDVVDTVLTAIENIKTLRPIFMKAYSLNIEFPIVLYNLITLSIEQSVSFLIAVTIQYIKDTSNQSISAALDKVAYNNSRDNVLYKQLYTFNSSYASGEINEILKEVMKKGGIKEGFSFNNQEQCCDDAEECCPICKKIPCICKVAVVSPFDDEEKEAPCAGSEVPDTSDDENEPTYSMPVNGSVQQESIGSSIASAISSIPVGGKIVAGIALGAGVITVGLKLGVWLIKVCIPLLRSITYFCIHSRVSLSDALSTQAQFLEVNAAKLEYSSDMDESRKKKVIARQLKTAEKLKKLANFIAIDNKSAKKKADEDASNDDKEKVEVPDDDGGVF